MQLTITHPPPADRGGVKKRARRAPGCGARGSAAWRWAEVRACGLDSGRSARIGSNRLDWARLSSRTARVEAWGSARICWHLPVYAWSHCRLTPSRASEGGRGASYGSGLSGGVRVAGQGIGVCGGERQSEAGQTLRCPARAAWGCACAVRLHATPDDSLATRLTRWRCALSVPYPARAVHGMHEGREGPPALSP